jgi:hypothetical protein
MWTRVRFPIKLASGRELFQRQILPSTEAMIDISNVIDNFALFLVTFQETEKKNLGQSKVVTRQ